MPLKSDIINILLGGIMAEGYACIKVANGKYVSNKKFKSHDEANKWAKQEIQTRGLAATAIRDVVWPTDANGKPGSS